jgi:3-hydroxyacyl-CoA dehydrogenase, C-terminal domain/short chain dehydrogenase
VIPGDATSPEVIARVIGLLIDAGKRPAVVRSTPAFIANRLQMALFLECLRCVDEGIVTPEALDTVVSTSFGFRLPLFGPFAIADMAGLDVYQGILENLPAVYGDRFATPAAIGDRVARGDLGLKTGRGFRTFDTRTQRELPVARDHEGGLLAGELAAAGMDVNLKGAMQTFRAALPMMISKGGGNLIAISSVNGIAYGWGEHAHCSASKAALIGLTRAGHRVRAEERTGQRHRARSHPDRAVAGRSQLRRPAAT